MRHNISDESIWPILLTCLGPHGPLLPDLQRLELILHTYDRNEYLTPLLSPPLTTLEIYTVHSPKNNLLNLASARGCDLEDFQYRGPPTPEILEPIMSFETLKNVTLTLAQIPQLKPSVTIVQFLPSLPSLRALVYHIGGILTLGGRGPIPSYWS